VDVWLVRSDWPDDQSGRLAALLSADEQQGAERFKFKRDPRRFVARRTALRAVLRGYLGMPRLGAPYLHVCAVP
jgi:phosphopantetheinyl transferase